MGLLQGPETPRRFDVPQRQPPFMSRAFELCCDGWRVGAVGRDVASGVQRVSMHPLHPGVAPSEGSPRTSHSRMRSLRSELSWYTCEASYSQLSIFKVSVAPNKDTFPTDPSVVLSKSHSLSPMPYIIPAWRTSSTGQRSLRAAPRKLAAAAG